MKTEVVALEIELKINKRSGPYFSFNDTMLRAMQSGLCVLYEEVFICAIHHRLVVIAVGGSADLLVLTFSHHKQHYKKMVVRENEKAIQFFQAIVDGRIWKDCSYADKLNSFQVGYDLSIELSGLGLQLTPLVGDGLRSLRTQSIVAGEPNSWSATGNKIMGSYDLSIEPKEKFYRFCIN